jgi:HEAT repeats
MKVSSSEIYAPIVCPSQSVRRILLILGVFLCIRCYGVSVPSPNLQEVVNKSDAIAVGRVTGTRLIEKTTTTYRGSEISARLIEVDFHADAVLKGTGRLLRFRFILPDVNIGYRGVPEGQSRVVFLARSADGLQLTDPYYPSLPALPAEAADTSVFASVIACIQAALGSPVPDADQKRQAIWVLRMTPGEPVQKALRVASADPTTEVRLDAISALLARNDISVLPIAAAALIGPSNAIPSESRQNLIASIYDGIKDERAIPVVKTLLKASDPRVRQAAAMALRNTGAVSALGPLATALADSDELVRYFAVIGLAEIDNQPEWRPLLPDFKSNQAKYLEHWSAWATSNRSEP